MLIGMMPPSPRRDCGAARAPGSVLWMVVVTVVLYLLHQGHSTVEALAVVVTAGALAVGLSRGGGLALLRVRG